MLVGVIVKVGVIVDVRDFVSDGIAVAKGKGVWEGVRVGVTVADDTAGEQAAKTLSRMKSFINDFIASSPSVTKKYHFPAASTNFLKRFLVPS